MVLGKDLYLFDFEDLDSLSFQRLFEMGRRVGVVWF